MEAEEYVFSLPQEQVKFKLAAIKKRILAYIIDLIFFYFTFFSLYMSIFTSFFSISENTDLAALFSSDQVLMNRFAIAVYLSSFILLFYFILFEKEGGTIGKMILRLRVIGENNLDYPQLIIRNATKTFLFFLLPFDLLGFILIGKKFTDNFSKTNVYEQEKLDITFEHRVPTEVKQVKKTVKKRKVKK
jgi:uncharacterized RDD family membrane protein YckC